VSSARNIWFAKESMWRPVTVAFTLYSAL